MQHNEFVLIQRAHSSIRIWSTVDPRYTLDTAKPLLKWMSLIGITPQMKLPLDELCSLKLGNKNNS